MEKQVQVRLQIRIRWVLQLIALCEGDRQLAARNSRSTLYLDGKLAALYEEREFLQKFLATLSPITVPPTTVAPATQEKELQTYGTDTL